MRISGVRALWAGLKMVEKAPRTNATPRTSGRLNPTRYRYAERIATPSALDRSDIINSLLRSCLSARVPPTRLRTVDPTVLTRARYATSTAESVVVKTSQVRATSPRENPAVEVVPARKRRAKFRLPRTRTGLRLAFESRGFPEPAITAPTVAPCLRLTDGNGWSLKLRASALIGQNR